MALFNWSNAWSVGIDELDAQHQNLMNLMNGLEDAMFARKEHDILERLLSELLHYTVYHFGFEEQLMRHHQYEELVMHQREHVKFSNRIALFKRKLATGDVTISSELLRFMQDWLTEHILVTDRKLSQILLEAQAECETHPKLAI